MNDSSSKQGRIAEQVAAAFLLGRGWTIATMNYRTTRGEIDIIALDGECLVFIEVKSGKFGERGSPALRVGPIKQKRIILTAQHYLADNISISDSYRFDVLSLVPNKDGTWKIEHIQDAFRLGSGE